MKKIYLIGIIVAIIVTTFVILSVSVKFTTKAEAGGDGFEAHGCVASSSSMYVIKEASTQILATSSSRAWARIQVGNNATNTISLMLNDVTAVNNQGILLNHTNTGGASSTPFIDFGLNADMPFLGVVKAITNYGTST